MFENAMIKTDGDDSYTLMIDLLETKAQIYGTEKDDKSFNQDTRKSDIAVDESQP